MKTIKLELQCPKVVVGEDGNVSDCQYLGLSSIFKNRAPVALLRNHRWNLGSTPMFHVLCTAAVKKNATR